MLRSAAIRFKVPASISAASSRRVMASHPSINALERVEGCSPAVGAVGPRAHVVAQALGVEDAPHPEVVHAVRHVVVLAPSLPGQLRAAPPAAFGIFQHRPLSEDLQGPVHHREVGGAGVRVAVDDIHGLARVRCHVLSQTIGEEHSIGINFYGPIEVPESPKQDDLVPSCHEQLRISRCSILRDSNRDLRDLMGLERAIDTRRSAMRGGAHSDHPIGEDVVPVACENSRTNLHLRGQQTRLVACSPHDGEAVEGGIPDERQAPTARAQCLATPRLVAILGIRGRGALFLARSPIFALLVALVAHAQAALGLAAVFAKPGAPLRYPLGDDAAARPRVSSLSRWWSARADLCASPGLLPTPVLRHPWRAAVLALRPKVVLLETLHPGLGATLRLAAVL
mmetsp:Transcript_54193/g.116337  ORF Transcript_54193/g.116337 Transcript_54193/m.116337 type:complete len:397 (-) Transcript_54193:1175-2365(-)